MKKIFQKIVDFHKGDCLQAAIASLLEIPYEESPRFIEHPNWFEPLMKLLDEKSLKWKGHLWNPTVEEGAVCEDVHLDRLSDYDGVGGYFWASVFSPRFGQPITHAVIIDKNFNIVHDPNPEYAGLKSYPLANEIGYNGIVYVSLIED